MSGAVFGTLAAGRPSARFVGKGVGALPGGSGLVALAAGSVSGGRVSVGSASLLAPGVVAGGAADVRLGTGAVSAQAEGSLNARVDLEPLAFALGLGRWEGSARGAARVAWPAAELPLSGETLVSWKEVTVEGLGVPDGRASAGSDGTRADVRVDIEGASLVAAVAGGGGEPRIDGRLDWSDLEAVGLQEVVLRRPTGLQVAAWTSGSLGFAGPLREPEAWSGRGSLRRFDLEGPSFTSSLSRAAAIELRPGAVVEFPASSPVVIVGSRGSEIRVSGTAALLGEKGPTLAIDLDGVSDLRVLEVLEPDLIASGEIQSEIEIRGLASDPDFYGTMRVRGGRLRLLSLDEGIDSLFATLSLDGDRVVIDSASARAGGGELTASGEIDLDGWAPAKLGVSARARDVALSIPSGIWGRYDADLELEGAAGQPLIRGEVRVQAGRYSRPFEFGKAFAARRRLVDPGFGIASWLSRVGLRIRFLADESFSVRNDMARLETSIRMDVSGTAARPTFSGNVSLLEGGRFDFKGIDYTVLSGQLTLDDLGVEPVRLRLRAGTDIRGYRIRLELDTTTTRVDYELSSVPALSEADILALLVTGETLAEGGGGGLSSAQLAGAYFGSELGEMLLSGTARRLFGLTIFQIAPSRVDAEASPTARLTLGRRIDDRTVALYSTDISSDSEDVYRLEREISRNYSIAASSDSGGDVGLDVGWLARLGSARGTGEDEASARKLDSVRVEGLPEEMSRPSRRKLGLRGGQQVRRVDSIEARERLARMLLEAGYMQAGIDEREEITDDGELVMVFEVEPGPPWTIETEGPTRPVRDVRERLYDLWVLTEFRPGLEREAERVALEVLAEQGYATALVNLEISDDEARVIRLAVDPGPRVSVARVELEGVQSLDEKDVMAQVLSRPAPSWRPGSRVTFKPRLVTEDANAIRTLYESYGHLEVAVDPRIRFSSDGSQAVVTFVVNEGPLARVRFVTVDGDWPDRLGPATSLIPFTTGDVFQPEKFEEARRSLTRLLDESGYYSAVVSANPVVDGADVDLEFRVKAGPRALVGDVEIDGLDRTRETTVRRVIELEQGEPLSRRSLDETEQSLFELGLFRDVEITHEPAGEETLAHAVTIRVRETPPVSLFGSVGWSTEDKLSATAVVSHENLTGRGRTGSVMGFGSSRTLGIRTTLEGRGLLRRSLEDLLTLSWIEEQRDGFTTETASAAIQIGTLRDRRRRWQASYVLDDTRFKDVTLDPDALRDELLSEGGRIVPVRLGSLRGAWVRDRRDDPFLPSSGWIVRADGGVWAKALASEPEFSRINGEVTAYQPITGKVSLATSLRVGVSWPRNETERVTLSERFFAGGANSVRGFERDKLGPLDAPGGNPLGGEAIVIGNLEARYRVMRQFELATFIDVGNVWLEPEDLDLGQLRKTWGVSVRFRTPVGPIRLGYGRKFEQLPGESSGELFVAIGEPF